jgi:2-iminobutanoate/2-iminopropanoate deaminase
VTKQPILTPDAPNPIGPYSQGMTVEGSLVITAGQIGIVPSTGQIVARDIESQTKQVLENLKAILEAGGSSMEAVVKTTVYLKDMTEFGAMNDVYGRYFKNSPPARTTVEVARLPRDVRVEIEAVGLVVNK